VRDGNGEVKLVHKKRGSLDFKEKTGQSRQTAGKGNYELEEKQESRCTRRKRCIQAEEKLMIGKKDPVIEATQKTEENIEITGET